MSTLIHKQTFAFVLFRLIDLHLSEPHEINYILEKCSELVGEHYPINVSPESYCNYLLKILIFNWQKILIALPFFL